MSLPGMKQRPMLLIALLLTGGGLVLAQQAWIGSPRLHVPPTLAYVLAVVTIVAALMVGLQAYGVLRWNDLLAALLLLGVTAEMLWLWWSLRGSVPWVGFAVVALVVGGMSLWAIRRSRAGPT
jgi:drug/metabolite transporter (DMT)-like permease